MSPDLSKPIFCEKCMAYSTAETPGDISNMHAFGREFYGESDPCEACGAVTKTLWFTVINIPMIPLGSYRHKTSSDGMMKARFWARKTATHWPQMMRTGTFALIAWMTVITLLLVWIVHNGGL